jgi:hypothetical protein
MVERAYNGIDKVGYSHLDGTLRSIASSFRGWDNMRARRVARLISGRWITGGEWNTATGRGCHLALIGLDAAEDEPALVSELLNECLSAAETEMIFGRPDPRLVKHGLFRPANGPLAPRDAVHLAQVYAKNSMTYWADGRKWRSFSGPADVLRSVESIFPEGASWARAVATAVASIVEIDFNRAAELACWLADPGERLVAHAALADALASCQDPRAARIVSHVLDRALNLPRYEALFDLETLPSIHPSQDYVGRWSN